MDDVAGEFGEFPMRTTDSFRSLGGWGAGTRPSDRTARRTHDRTHPARSQRGADYLVRVTMTRRNARPSR